LTTATPERAQELAAYLEEQNRRRQTMEREILQKACAMIEEDKLATDAAGGSFWLPRLARRRYRIVASRVVERYGRTTVLIAVENGIGQGSARSVRNSRCTPPWPNAAPTAGLRRARHGRRAAHQTRVHRGIHRGLHPPG
jgi:single-stranded DNA-specific DHH superfamily exonuclease